MAMKIDIDSCAACGACQDECPNNAISFKGGNYAVSAKKCTNCSDIGSPRCASICPSGSIEQA